MVPHKPVAALEDQQEILPHPEAHFKAQMQIRTTVRLLEVGVTTVGVLGMMLDYMDVVVVEVDT